MTIATGAWSCTFNKPLQPGVLNAANWSLRASDDTWSPSSASASGAVVSGASAIGFPDPGPDVIAYAAVAPDVISLQGLPAAAFLDFPMIVT